VSKTFTVVLVLLTVASPFWAATTGGIPGSADAGVQSASGGAIQPADASPLQISMRFFDQKVYFLGDPDPINVEVAITNTGTDPLRFQVADNRFFNLDFDVRTLTNVGLEHAEKFISDRNADQPVFFREVSLGAQEKYSFDVDLKTFAKFISPGQYVVQGTFYPQLFRGTGSLSVSTNRLALNLKPAVATAAERSVVEAETGALLARQPLPPDEVVTATIAARQKSQWARFFLYLDLESLLRKNPEKDRAFRNATEVARRQMVDQFRQQLQAMTIQQDISVVPSSFQVQKTSYDPAEAMVQVLEKFKYPDYTELKAYNYHLKKTDRFWVIDDYSIRNLGTE
jgi:hypothetical protein